MAESDEGLRVMQAFQPARRVLQAFSLLAREV